MRELISRREEPRPHDLVLFHPPNADMPSVPNASVLRLAADLRLNLRGDADDELDRLARLVTGQANGLVLAGGGARGYSHIGVIKALVGGQDADRSDRRFEHRLDYCLRPGARLVVGQLYDNIKEAFFDSNPVNDYTLPFVALTRGNRVTRRLKRYFGDLTFDQTWRPFYCVSSNLTKGDVELHLEPASSGVRCAPASRSPAFCRR